MGAHCPKQYRACALRTHVDSHMVATTNGSSLDKHEAKLFTRDMGVMREEAFRLEDENMPLYNNKYKKKQEAPPPSTTTKRYSSSARAPVPAPPSGRAFAHSARRTTERKTSGSRLPEPVSASFVPKKPTDAMSST